MTEIKGKLPSHVLKNVLKKFQTNDPSIVLGPSIGEDFAVIRMNKNLLVVHSDPITGATKRIGWYAVHIVCNDIATSGARPRWIVPVILLPVGRYDILNEIIEDISSVTEELGISVVGGHTEFTPGLERPIISMTAFAEASMESLILTRNSKPGDKIILTKGVAIEGTSIIAHELENILLRHISRGVIEEAKKISDMISVVRDAEVAIKFGGVHAMHDPTEGGIAMGLQELAFSSGYGLEVYEEDMIFLKPTVEIIEVLGIDPLRLISSGALLIVADKDKADEIVKGLNNEGIRASIIGEVIEDKDRRVVYRKNGGVLDLNGYIEEELWRILEKYKKL